MGKVFIIKDDGTECELSEPIVIYFDDKKAYYNNIFLLHRENGPAVEYTDGTKCWYLNDNRHREDGPAVEYYSGYKRWYYNGEFIGASDQGFTQEDFERYLKIKEYW